MSRRNNEYTLIAYLILCLTLFVSCTKTKNNVHFNGKITIDCNNHQPVANATITIERYYDTGTQDASNVGTTLTDNDGYYSLVTDVKQKGGFEHYRIIIDAADFTGTETSNNNSDNVEINYEHEPQKTYKFHLKNTSPFNSSDILHYFVILGSGNYQFITDTIVTKLIGTSVDTIILIKKNYQISYSFSFTKNNTLTTNPTVTISNASCSDTTQINTFY
jgi:hypothetical protein